MDTSQTRELLPGVDREEEAPPSKAPLGEDQGSQTRAQGSMPLTSEAAGRGHGPGPAPSCESLRSDWSMGRDINFRGGQNHQGSSRLNQEKLNSELSCESLKSDRSMDLLIDFKGGQEPRGEREDQQVSDVLSLQCVQQHQTDLDSTLQLLEETVMTLVKKQVRSVQRFLSPDDPKYQDDEEKVKVKCDEEQMRSSREAFLDFIMNLLRSMKEEELADRVWSRSRAGACAGRLKRSLQKKFHSVFEGVAKAGNSAPLNQIYTELYITEGGTDQVNQEHEVRQIEAATRNQTRAETTIRLEDLFKASPERDGPIRSLLTKGVAGIGKTLLTQKLTLDWAEEKAHQNFQLMFPFTFRELNLLKEKQLSLVELVHRFFPETKDSGLSSFEGVQVLFILDGLDECRLPLDFNSRVLTEATESTSVDVLLTNLIRGKLLPSAQLWMTTRPAAANQIPPECVDMVTEVRGFTDLQIEEYFRKRFRDEEQTTIISHIRSSRSLYIMCHIPIFCWITATVLEDMLKNRESEELPKTLTKMYIHFLVVQAKVKKLKYHGGAGTDPVWDPESRKMIESLGKLAFEHLQRGNLIFYESDLTECGIDITAAAVYSGVFTQIFREERGLYQDKVFCFIHLSLQEFLAALHVHLKFFISGVNLLYSQETCENKHHHEQFYQRAINEAVESPNGHLDLFLRFLLGLSLQSSQSLLPGLLPLTGSSFWTHQDTAELIKKKISEKLSPESVINLFHCLSEVKDTSLVEQLQQQLRSGRLSSEQLSPAQWSTLVSILLSSEEDLEVFDLKKYSASDKALDRLLPVVQASKAVLLRECQLSERSCSLLSSVLSSPSSCLTQLDLSYNYMYDSALKLLCAGLKSPHCHLETLSLSWCLLSERSGSLLSSVLSSPSSRLTQLDLSDNYELKDPGVELLCAGLKSPHCHLETLSLVRCDLSERSGSLLSSVLSSPSTRLTQLDLSYNYDLKDPGVELLCAGLKSPHCHLETLSLIRCFLSERSGSLLSSVLSSPSSRLTQLDLSHNYELKDPGVELLCVGLKSPHCHLETLSLSRCQLSERSGSLLSSVLSSPSSRLTQLDLSHNYGLKDPGVELLCAGLKSPHCHLETLSLSWCFLSERSGSLLSSVLSSPSSRLTQLDLSDNIFLKDPGVELLCAGLKSPHCHLETLRLRDCQLSERSCSLLSSVFSSPSSRLTQLDLSYNYMYDSALKLLCAGLKSPHCHLETLSLSRCGLSERSGSILSSVLSSPSSRLTQLDLSHNYELKDPGVELLCAGLKSPHCHLETLSLSWCGLSERSGSLLSSVLSSPSSRLTQLDLSHNNLKDPGVELLCAGLKSPHCHLETLSLIRCFLSERSGSLLSSVLSSPSSRLTQLDLSYNYELKDPGVELLCAGLKSPHCHLETLSLIRCFLSEGSGSLLSSVLSSPSSRLTQLDLSYNYELKDPGVEQLCAGLKSPHCHLETLRSEHISSSLQFCSTTGRFFCSHDSLKHCSSFISLSGCRISERDCASLASALTSNPSHLRELDLSFNHPGGPGLELLSAGLESPDWRLETLRLDHCGPQRLTPGVQRYFRPLSLDPDTAHRRLLLSNNNCMVEQVTEDQDYLDHDDRFERCPQVMSRDAVTGPCYWELEWRGRVSVAVTLRRDGGKEDESEFGRNHYSWSLSCSDDAGYKFCHNKRETVIESSEVSHRLGVLLNCPAGFLGFFRVSSGVQTHLRTLFTSTEPLYLGFGLGEVPGSGSSVCVCDLSV
ncbi:NACHT, LRR and PYD domains-containing protein 3-like isoform 31-T34 [Synchiropus picturatus]